MNQESKTPRRDIKIFIRRGKGDRAKFTYGTIRDFHTDELLVSATLTYCENCINERNYHIMALITEDKE